MLPLHESGHHEFGPSPCFDSCSHVCWHDARASVKKQTETPLGGPRFLRAAQSCRMATHRREAAGRKACRHNAGITRWLPPRPRGASVRRPCLSSTTRKRPRREVQTAGAPQETGRMEKQPAAYSNTRWRRQGRRWLAGRQTVAAGLGCRYPSASRMSKGAGAATSSMSQGTMSSGRAPVSTPALMCAGTFPSLYT